MKSKYLNLAAMLCYVGACLAAWPLDPARYAATVMLGAAAAICWIYA